jgi:DNA-binding transcriptional LysR family regulator
MTICAGWNNQIRCNHALQKTQNMIDALELFLAVVARGNFSKVAQARSVAVSSVTRKIGWLEGELGAKLFTRSSRRLTLTDAGENFLPRAQNILAEMAEAKDAVSSLNAEPRGLLSVTAPATFGRLHVAPAVASFLKKYPMMEVELHLSDEMIDVAGERVDVAVRIGTLASSDLLATRLAPQRRVACASPGYLAQFGRPKSPEDLLKHACLTVRSAHSPRRLVALQGSQQRQSACGPRLISNR